MPDAGGQYDVLDADGQAVQWSHRLVVPHGLLGGTGGDARLLGRQCDDRVELRIDTFDDCKVRVQNIHRTDGSASDERRQLAGRFARQRLVSHLWSLARPMNEMALDNEEKQVEPIA
jgi:hypothetical protein